MTTTPKSRVAAGVPTGGQFAASAHAESAVSLAPDANTDANTDADTGPVDQTDAYDAARRQVESKHLDFQASLGYHPGPAAEQFVEMARSTANGIAPRDLPGPGETAISAQTGRLYGAAEAAAFERSNEFGPADFATVEAVADRLADQALDTRDFTSANGVPFRARLIRPGQSWGRDGGNVAKEDMVFFFDARHSGFDPMIGSRYDERERDEDNGQFVANYAVSSLRDHRRGCGLDLHGGVPDWTIDGGTYDQVVDWMDRRAPLRDSPFADCSTRVDLAAALEQAQGAPNVADLDDLAGSSSRQRALTAAYETRLREIERGWDSLT